VLLQPAGRRKGGRERSKKAAVLGADAPDVPLTSVADVLVLLAQTINQVRRGELDTKVGSCLGYLASVAMKALEETELRAQLEVLKRQLACAHTGPNGTPIVQVLRDCDEDAP
jgi:hypothetical protein